MAIDHASRAITSILKPLLNTNGFYRRSPKLFVRVRENLVDVISFQMSQYGSKHFYLHYFCNLLPTPNWEQKLTGYQVGHRIQQDNDGPLWVADSETTAPAAMKSVISVCQKEILPWFDNISGVKEWLIEYIAKPNSNLETFEVSVALLLLGHTNKPWWILSTLSEKAIDSNRNIERQKDFKLRAKNFASAVDNNSYLTILNQWRDQNIINNKIQKAVQTNT